MESAVRIHAMRLRSAASRVRSIANRSFSFSSSLIVFSPVWGRPSGLVADLAGGLRVLPVNAAHEEGNRTADHEIRQDGGHHDHHQQLSEVEGLQHQDLVGGIQHDCHDE